MSGGFDYTTRARKMAFRFPTFSYILMQVNLWIIAFILFSTLIKFTTSMINETSPLPIHYSFTNSAILSVILGIIFGTAMGLADITMERTSLKKLTLGAKILIFALTYPILLFGILSFMRYVVYELIIVPIFPGSNVFSNSNVSWKYIILMLVIYTTFVSAFVGFINQMNRRFSPGMMLPLLLGRYRKPKEQERFFMFLDLKSSTEHAEVLGHLKYSAMIRDSFMDINSVVYKYNAEIYQYVGDEVVLSWPVIEGIRNLECIRFFFSVREIFSNRSQYYNTLYGFVPEFKAGLHLGKVTIVEVGEIKREIAFHGDTLNTASRIQGLCTLYGVSFLISGLVKDVLNFDDANIKPKMIGNVLLKGKKKSVDVFSVEKN